MYTAVLESFGFEVAAAGDATRAVAMIASRRPDVIVTDLSLPYLDGWAFIRHLQRSPETHSTPIIVVTGHAEPSTRERALAGGARLVLTKPCDPLVLEKAVRNVLYRTDAPVPLVGGSGRTGTRARLRWSDGHTTDLPVFDEACLEVLQTDASGTHHFVRTGERDAEGFVILSERDADRRPG
jgi:CheY-like chemotaxis protein